MCSAKNYIKKAVPYILEHALSLLETCSMVIICFVSQIYLIFYLKLNAWKIICILYFFIEKPLIILSLFSN